MKSGVLLLNKPVGLTSHDCVEEIRALLPRQKIGHGGTLDPIAEGILPILVNEATKLTPFLAEVDKEYRVTIVLGAETDTDDAQGKIVRESPIAGIDREKVERALELFRGEIDQVPPLYSAIKLRGIPLYKRARRGEQIKLPPRKVRIAACTLCSFNPPRLELFIHCSRGTYIRALARDLGRELGCGAHVERLTRTLFGPFTIDQAKTLDQLKASPDSIEVALLPLADALTVFPTVWLSREQASAVRKGRAPLLKSTDRSLKEGKVKLLDQEGELVAVAETLKLGSRTDRMMKLIRVF